MKRTRSEARREYWASIPKEERSRRAARAARMKAAKMTPQERSAHGTKMVAARHKKAQLLSV